MQSFPIEFLNELESRCAFLNFLFVLKWSSTHYWTDCKKDINYSGQWYRSKGIAFDAIAVSTNPKVDSVTLSIDDVDRRTTKIILSEDIRDKEVWIYLVALDKNLQAVSPPRVFFMGYSESASRPRGKKDFDIKVYNHMIKWKRIIPRYVTSPTCQNEFKHGPDKLLGTDSNTYTCIKNCVNDPVNRPITGGSWATYWTLSGSGGAPWVEGEWSRVGTCRYAGAETWCDMSWDRCNALGNTDHFRGCRWLPGILGKELWWGSPSDPTVRAATQR